MSKTSASDVNAEQRSDEYVDIEELPYLLGLKTKNSGVVVTPESSLTYSVVFACVDAIASTISILPLNIFKTTENGKEKASDHDQYYILKKEPHRLYSRVHFLKTLVAHHLLWGDAYARINRNALGRPISYTILDPWDVRVEKIAGDDGEKYLAYKYKNEPVILDYDIIHISDLSLNGKKGVGRIASNHKTIEQGINLRDFGLDLTAEGAKINGYIYGDKKMTKDAYLTLARNFMTGYGSEERLGILPHGWKYEPFKYSLPAADAQIIESKKLSKEDVYTIFRCPGFLVGDTGNINNDIATVLVKMFLQNTISPITTLIEAEFDRKVFRESEKNTHYIKFNLFALIKADIKETMEALRIGVNAGILNKDEARDTLDRNPIEGGHGKTFYQAINTIPLGMAEDYYKNNKSNDKEKDS